MSEVQDVYEAMKQLVVTMNDIKKDSLLKKDNVFVLPGFAISRAYLTSKEAVEFFKINGYEVDMSSFLSFRAWAMMGHDVILSCIVHRESKQFFTKSIHVILDGEKFFKEAKNLLEVEAVLNR